MQVKICHCICHTIYMISVRNPLLQKFELSNLYYFFRGIPWQDQTLCICWYPEGSGRFPEACPEAYICFTASSQFRKVPEGVRKLVRKLVSFLFVFLQFRKIPEDFRKLVRKPTCFLQHHRSSGRFRKVSGSLSGSLLLFSLAFCNSGRFRKIPGSLSGSLFEPFDLLHSGSFRKVSGRPTGRSTKHQVLFLGL